MTPKEKARELVDKIKLATDEFGYININTERHKQCALIAVDEIIKYVPQFEYGQGEKTTTTEYDYLQEVKLEIEKI